MSHLGVGGEPPNPYEGYLESLFLADWENIAFVLVLDVLLFLLLRKKHRRALMIILLIELGLEIALWATKFDIFYYLLYGTTGP
jgi:hypothetical protein